MPSVAQHNKPQISRWAIFSLCLSTLISALGVSIVNVALPTLSQVFNSSFQHIQWVVLAYLLTLTAVIVAVGRLGDMFGKRRLLLLGMTIFTVAAVVCSLASVLWLLIAGRAVQGLGAAILMTQTIAIVREVIAENAIGRAMGMLGSMSAIGTALGPSLCGFLLAFSSWRSIFIIMAMIGFISLFLIQRYLPRIETKIEPVNKRIDIIGMLLLALTLSTYALAMTMEKQHLLLLIILTVIFAALFIFVEMRAAVPMLALKTFRNKGLSASLVINLLTSSVMMSTLVIGPLYLSQALLLPATLVGLIMSVGPIVGALSGFLAGRLVDKIGTAKVMFSGLTIMLCAMICLTLLPHWYEVKGYLIAMLLLPPGYQLFMAANTTSVMLAISAEQRGVISGLLNLSRHLGLITGASVMVSIFAFFSDHLFEPPAVAHGTMMTFASAIGFILLALVIAVAVRRERRVNVS